MASTALGYHGIGFNSPAMKLTESCGDRLEKMASGDKLGLIAILAAWLANDDEDYGLPEAMCEIQMTVTEHFYLYVAILADPENHISPDDALSMIAALTAQLKGKVYA
ncbi:hypothetical protein [Leptolyngbya sp. FACHB-17]|uniref:hypothetical protein n=1 Tax=unclassified Leptolyngbya TaxID=2650499 RepID=UPI001680FEE7|nr:hypothetical protein [Leptolyngbya sp. FACHB-17]MBD2079590.1 hypothetical protein [Leptolyngbya sp. FACHB-17]